MNNTTTRNLAVAAILIAAMLVVGMAGTFATTRAAFAANNNGNTVTAQINRQGARESGFDGKQEQEAQNVICTHPSAACTEEGSPTPTLSFFF